MKLGGVGGCPLWVAEHLCSVCPLCFPERTPLVRGAHCPKALASRSVLPLSGLVHYPAASAPSQASLPGLCLLSLASSASPARL